MGANVVNLPLSLLSLERKSKKHILFDLSSKQTRGICSAVFSSASCMFENCGWLLMVQHKPLHSEELTAFLVHPRTSKRINLPVLYSAKEGFFAFYVDSHGSPLVVAYIETMCDLLPCIHTACPGDLYWTVHEHASYHNQLKESYRFLEGIRIVDVALVGTEVICVDYYGKIVIFDITEMTWRMAFSPEWSNADEHFVVATKGGAVLISCSHPCSHPFKFSKLDLKALVWSPLDDSELDSSIWFLHKGCSFRVREEGKRKIYTFGSDSTTTRDVSSYGVAKPLREKSITNIFAHDLVDGTIEKVLPASIVTEACNWVQPGVFH